MPDKFIRRTTGLGFRRHSRDAFNTGCVCTGLETTVKTETGINKAASSSQKTVTSLAQQTADLLAEYRAGCTGNRKPENL